MTDDEKRQWIAGMFVTSPENISKNEVEALDALLDSVRAETRAAILADEERRVWCELHFRYEGSSVGAKNFADRMLMRWREARAAWEARDGRE